MHIGLVGLGKMGGNMRERLRTPATPSSATTVTPTSATSTACGAWSRRCPSPEGRLGDGAGRRADPRDRPELGELLGEGDVVVDGGNSRWTDDQAHADLLGEKGIGFVDCGVSGGVWGLENGYALMCGGDADNVAKVQPAFDALKPEGEFGCVHAGASAPATSPRWSTTASSTP